VNARERDQDEAPRDDASSTEPPVDGPGAAEGNDEPGATSADRPGGEHGTEER
jgi:hypothetical protein